MIWLKLFLITIIFELLTGTIYLLFISISFLITFLLYYFNIFTNFNDNLIITSIFIFISVICAYYFNKKSKLSNNNNISDLGNLVTIKKIENNFIYVKYKGTLWQSIIEKNIKYDKNLIGKSAKIINQKGNILVIELT